jgi:hypothetical protein
MREREKKSPFYVAYTQIGNLRIGNLRMRRKKLRKLSYAYMRIRYGAKEITASGTSLRVHFLEARAPIKLNRLQSPYSIG